MARFFLFISTCLIWVGWPGLLPSVLAESRTVVHEPHQDITTWYSITIGEQQAGWVRLLERHLDGQIETAIEQKMSFRRGQAEVTVELASNFLESEDGTPISAWTKQLLGGQNRQTFYEFTADEILIRSSADGEIERRVAQPELPWSTPTQSQKRLMQALANDETAFSDRTIDPNFGAEPVAVDWRRLGKNVEIKAADRTWNVSQWEQRQSWAPQLVTRVYLDAEGRMIRNEAELFGMKVVQTLTEDDPSANPHEAPEMLISTFVKPDRKIDRPRQLSSAVFELMSEHKLPPIPETSVQVVEQDEHSARLRIDLRQPNLGDDIEPEAFLRATPYLDHRSSEVRELLRQLETPTGATQRETALALRRMVHAVLDSKDLNSVFATASEVAASRSGDCTEHSVLLTALLRGAGIPARSVVGLTYAEQFLGSEGIFAYHMWSQAWLGGRWVDLDATLIDHTFDAAHIALQIVTLEDDQAAMRELAGLIPLMGDLKLRVLETTYE